MEYIRNIENFKELAQIRSFNYMGIIENIISRIEGVDWEDEDLFNVILCCMDDELIYYEDQWIIIQEFFTPQECNGEKDVFFEAWENVQNDIYRLIKEK